MPSKSMHRKFDNANKLFDIWNEDAYIIMHFRKISLRKIYWPTVYANYRAVC
jgi:hypothetical protein